jgi:histidine ammonia-lyase
MGWGAGKKLAQVIDNARRVIAIEILCATQGIEYRRPLTPGAGAGAVADLIREHVPTLEQDRPLSEEIETVAALIGDGSVASAADS